MNIKVYILLPVHNRCSITTKFIHCLVAQSYSNYHLILIDDGSTDGTAEMAQSFIPELTLLTGKGNWWWAGSLQQGIDWLKHNDVADSDVILFINDDVTFEDDFLQIAISNLHRQEGMLLPQIMKEQTGLIEETGLDADLKRFTFKTVSSPERINCFPTRGLFMRMSELKRVGDFYPRLLPHYWSDYEFTIRASRIGIRLYTNPELFIYTDTTTTGFRCFQTSGYIEFFRQYFSKKSVINPIFTSIFIVKTCPLKYIPVNLIKVWRNSVITILRNLRLILNRRIDASRVLNELRHSENDLKIIIGSSSTKQDGWISTNYPQLDLTNINTFTTIFAQESINNFLAEHVWEHLSIEDGAEACHNCFSFLKSGGTLRIAVPDGFHADADYIAQVKPGGYGTGADDHKVLFNYKTLSDLLEHAGYQVRLLEWFDEEGNFHHEGWNIADGMIRRSTRYDHRNKVNPITYTSLIIDAVKP